MPFSYPKYLCAFFRKAAIPLLLIILPLFPSCKHNNKIYSSSCNDNRIFKRISLSRLTDSIENYKNQYVEVQGTYQEGKGVSALVSDSLFADHSTNRALWVNFSQDCPLYLAGTRIGLFEYNDGKFTQLGNKILVIRGKIGIGHKGRKGSYRGEIDRISYVTFR